jgi:hypothetical protein
MSKKIALFALGLALALVVPATARPPLCTCPLCAVGNTTCSLPDGSLTTCGVYFGSHCTGPNLAPGRRGGAPAMQEAAPPHPRGASARGNGERRTRTVRRPSGTGNRSAATLRRHAGKRRRRSTLPRRRAVPENAPSPTPSRATYA